MEITFSVNKKIVKKINVHIQNLQESTIDTEIKNSLKINREEYSISISLHFFTHNKKIEGLSIPYDQNPAILFDVACEAFIHKYLYMNSLISYVNRDEEQIVDDENNVGMNLFKSSNPRKLQGISGGSTY